MYKEVVDKLLDFEEMKFYMNHFGVKKNPTFEKIKSWSKEKLKEEEKLINSKTSKLSRKERDLVIYFANKK